MSYDSEADTLKHIKRVNELLLDVIEKLLHRAKHHDDSKLNSPEKEDFDFYTPKLKDCEYDSDEYKQYLKELKMTLNHHYSKNKHHPEHFENGINDMNLIDILEMVVDWKAAGERHKDGGKGLFNSIQINKERFNISPQLVEILINTIEIFDEKEYE